MPIRAESVTDLLNQRRACDVNVALVDVATITLTPFMFHFTINHLMELQVLRFHTSCAVMILTLPFSRFHHFVVLIFTKSGSQLCTVQQDPTVRLQGRDCAADCRCQACHRRSNSFTHQTSSKSTWTHRRVTVLNF